MEKICSLEIRRARKGDCLLLHYGTKTDPGLGLIDGGPSSVYKPQLAPRLAQIKKARKLDSAKALPVDLLMVSHIDDDHIKGILDLTKELTTAKDNHAPLSVKVLSLWHNSFNDIIGDDPEDLVAAVKTSFGPASLAGDIEVQGIDPAAAMVLASVEQGFRLRDDAKKLGWPVNPEVDGHLIQAEVGGAPIDLGRGLTMTVAGPMKGELAKLQKAHDDWRKKHPAAKKKTDALASFTDKSVANLSSLVLLAEVGGRRILLTGDARGDKILEGLELVGLLEKGGSMHVDVFKVPHHGSDRNVEPVLFHRVTADHYVFSGDGEHGNPERETLQMLLDERDDEDFAIHLTYPPDKIDVGRRNDWEKKQTATWSPKKQGLVAFFSANPDFAKKVLIVDEKKGHVIDLLDPVGF